MKTGLQPAVSGRMRHTRCRYSFAETAAADHDGPPLIFLLREFTLHSGGNASQGAGSEVRAFAEAAVRTRFYGAAPHTPLSCICAPVMTHPLQAAVIFSGSSHCIPEGMLRRVRDRKSVRLQKPLSAPGFMGLRPKPRL